MLPLQVRVDLGALAIKGYSAFPKSSSITGTSPSDCLVSYLGHSLVGFFTPLQRSTWCILHLQLTGQICFVSNWTLLLCACLCIHQKVCNLMIKNIFIFLYNLCPVGWGCRIHRLLLCRGVRPPTNESPVYDTKQSDGEVPAMLELWGIRSTPLLPSLPVLI